MVVGGCACIPGLRERLRSELSEMGTYGVELEVKDPPYYMPGCPIRSAADLRKCAALRSASFCGAGVLAGQRSIYDANACSLLAYNERGPEVAHALSGETSRD